MANFYRRRAHELHELLQHGPEAARLKAAETLRALISAIVLTPRGEGLEVDVQGNLAGILAIASNTKSPRPEGKGRSRLKVVAGTRFTRYLRSPTMHLATTAAALVTPHGHYAGLFSASA